MQKVTSLGHAISVVRQQVRSEQEAHEDLHIFYAPSECHGDVERGFAHDRRLVRKRVKAMTGLKWNAFLREIRQRTTNKCARSIFYFNM